MGSGNLINMNLNFQNRLGREGKEVCSHIIEKTLLYKGTHLWALFCFFNCGKYT